MSLATMECGRQDSILHGLPGNPPRRKHLGSTASGSQNRRVYRFRHVRVASTNNYLSDFGAGKICQHRRRGFHAAALGASGRVAPIHPAFSLEDLLDDALRPYDATVVQLVASRLANATSQDIIRNESI